MRRVMQIRRLRFVPLHRKCSTHLESGDVLEVVRVKPARHYRNGREVPERVIVQVTRELPRSEFDIIASEHDA